MATASKALVGNNGGINFVPQLIDTRLLFRGPQYEIQDNAGLIPQHIVVRQIDMAPAGSDYPFVFKSPDRRYQYTPNNLQNIVAQLLDGTYRPNGMVNQYYRPLDVKLSATTCFVFHLVDSWPWRFSSKQDGATIGESLSSVQQRYANLRHFIDVNGSPTHYPHDQFCRTICFTADPELDAMSNVIPFQHLFNLVVEFVYPDGDAPNVENVIPVIIDPDIRYPGGSGT